MPTRQLEHLSRRGRRLVRLMLFAIVGVLTVCASTAASARPNAPSPEQINGDGSSWAANAISQWISDTNAQGLQVVYTSNGSSTGRNDFANSLNQFADSDIAYGQDPSDPSDASSRAYSYLPVVAGGTSFPYHLEVAGQLYRDLRLSGPTLAKIFTNQITNWNDPAITKDNNGRALPSLTIHPVVRSDGSGATAQFTFWLDKQYPTIWEPFYGHTGGTSYWPTGKSGQISQNGSDQVVNYITSGSGNGTIAYDEYSYALQVNYPVAKVENTAGYYTLPTQYNVAVGLTQATVDTTDTTDPSKYLTQQLNNVYTNPDARAYPLSSYSYFIIPTAAADSQMNSGKRQALANFLYYSLCQGQAEMGPLGYSPLPINLVQASFNQVAKLSQADPNVDLTNQNVSTCNNPTFVAGNPNQNYLAQVAPQPLACDKDGAGPCGASDVAAVNANPTTTSSGTAAKGGTTSKATASKKPTATSTKVATGTTAASGAVPGAAAATGTGATTTGTAATGATAADPATGATVTTGAAAGAGGAAAVDPATGTTVSAGDSSGAGSAGDAFPTASNLASSQSSAPTNVLAPLAVVLLFLIVLLPVLMSQYTRRKTKGISS